MEAYISRPHCLQNYFGGQLQVPDQDYSNTKCYDILTKEFDEQEIDDFLNDNTETCWYGFGRIDDQYFALMGNAEITSSCCNLYVVEVEKTDVPEHIQELFVSW
jgi:hypothetical protein